MSIADKLHQRQMALRKKSGLPHPDYYKELGHSYSISDDKERLAKQSEIKKKYKVEETEVNEQLHKKGRFVSGPVKKPYKSSTIATPIREAKDPREYDYEGDMAVSQLRAMIFNAEDLIDMMDDDTNLPEWVQSKITLAEDYISTAANYLRGELNEEVKVGQKVHLGLKQKGASGMRGTVHKVEGNTVHVKVGSGIFGDRIVKGSMKNVTKEEVELSEGRSSQRHPLEGHDKLKKEETEYLEEKNEPTNPALWSKAKSLARSKFDVYPSAYANGWAAKWYKSKGGGWKSVNEDTDEPSAAARTLSRKAQIVKDAAKSKKREQEEASDKFQKDPELSSDMQKT